MSKILVVDDEPVIRRVCYEMLTKKGHQVLTCSRGDQVFSLIRKEELDLIIMDLCIPGEEGLSLLKSLPNPKGKNRIPIVLFSGYVTSEIEKEAMRLGAAAVFRKDEDMVDLSNKIEKILSSCSRANQGEGSSKQERVLIVDDEAPIRKMLKSFFDQKGYEVFTASSGEEALSIVEDHKPNMILLDVIMPGMDGLVTLEKIREIDREVGVVMATGMKDEEMAQRASRLGAYAYVLKPFDFEYLELVVLTKMVMA